MPFTVTITEQFPDDSYTERFKQTVDSLDLRKVIETVNNPPPAPKKVRKDKGIKRPAKTEVVA